jgi:hypothetical protein
MLGCESISIFEAVVSEQVAARRSHLSGALASDRCWDNPSGSHGFGRTFRRGEGAAIGQTIIRWQMAIAPVGYIIDLRSLASNFRSMTHKRLG